MEKNYINKLIEQFKSATGTKNIDVTSEVFISEFSEWIKKRMAISKGYVNFVDYMGVYPSIGYSTYEIGKGKYDSIAKEAGICMITPYFEDVPSIDVPSIIKADFEFCLDTPIIVRKDNGKYLSEVLDTKFIDRFITQNPYNQYCIRNWEQLHNVGENITVGVYGNTFDKDMESKFKQIEMLRDGFVDGCFKEEHGIDGDSYYYVVSSNRKPHVRVLER